MTEQQHCIGCGVPIQTTDENALGYTPTASLEKEVVYCKRCFRLRNYNELQPVSLTSDDFLRMLHRIGETSATILYLVDIFDFDGSWIHGLHRFVGNNPIILVGNKVDILPKSVKHRKVEMWMRRRSKQLGLQVQDVALISATKGNGLQELLESVQSQGQNKDVFVVGCTNVGKSTFINALLKRFGGEEESVITTSHFPGTTLDFIHIPFGEEASIIDTPGVVNHHQMTHLLSPEAMKKVLPKKEIKPMVFQLQSEQTLFLGGLAQFDFVHGERSTVNVHASNDMYIHRTKLANATRIWDEQRGALLVPTFKDDEQVKMITSEWTTQFEKTDIVFSGIGWITIHGKGRVVRAHVPQGVAAFIREALI